MVIAIVGVLSSSVVALINPVKQLQKTKDSQRKADLKQIQTALELYRADLGVYPTTASYPTGCGTSGSLAAGGVTYINSMPCDGKRGSGWANYTYNRTSPSTYTLRTCIENEDDADPLVVNIATGTCSSGKAYTVNSP